MSHGPSQEMDHARCEELLAVYRDLLGAEHEAVDRHVGECPACAALLASNQAADRDLARLHDPEPPAALRERFLGEVTRERGRKALFRRRLARLAEVALAATLSVVACLVIYGRVHPGLRGWPLSRRPVVGSPTAAPAPTVTLTTPGPGVADLLAHPPAPGETVEVDAYYAGAWATPFSGGPRLPDDQVACPYVWQVTLTDRPFAPALKVLNLTHGNTLPDSEAWLVAVTPEQAQPGVRTMPQLPYHARLRGHLGEPALAHCTGAERIFVVEGVAQVYEMKAPQEQLPLRLPEDYAAWPRHHDSTLGYSIPYPPAWAVQPLDETAVSLYPPDWPGFQVVVRVHPGEVYYDQYEPASAPPLLQGNSMGVFEQGSTFDGLAGSQRLAGYMVEREGPAIERTMAILFSAHGRTYELSVRYPLGFAARQPLLTAYSAMVEGFRLDLAPGSTPTPPVRQELGPGPFMMPQEALARLRESQGEGEDAELLASELVSEAEARRRGQACDTFTGHADGVWLLTVRGTFEGQVRTMLLFVDAVTGAQLCGEEVAPTAGGEFAIYIGSEPGGEVALSTDDLVAYDPNTHELALTTAAAARLSGLTVPTSGTPFVVCVGGEAIYRGAFYTMASSASYDGVVIITTLAERGTVRIQLGYPGSFHFTGKDPRADPRILGALERAGKLRQLAPGATPTPVMAGTRPYSDWTYGVALQYPAQWQPVEGYDVRYGGPDGYFQLGARSGSISIDEAAAAEANHKLRPYGSSPTIEALEIVGQEARLILPSADQPEGMERMAALLVGYPRPVEIRGETYRYLLLYADKEHIRDLAATLRFLDWPIEAGPVEGWPGTLVKDCSMAQFDDYFVREDGLRCGVEPATEAVRESVERLRCPPGARVLVWGRLETETMDSYGRRIVVERIQVVEAAPIRSLPAGLAEEAVEGWVGRVVPCGGSGVDRFFERDDGARFGIEAGAAVGDALYIAECEGYALRVWGTLYRGVEGYNGARLVVERVQRL